MRYMPDSQERPQLIPYKGEHKLQDLPITIDLGRNVRATVEKDGQGKIWLKADKARIELTPGGHVLIGRGADRVKGDKSWTQKLDIFDPTGTLSRFHAEVMYLGDTVQVHDLESKNGTRSYPQEKSLSSAAIIEQAQQVVQAREARAGFRETDTRPLKRESFPILVHFGRQVWKIEWGADNQITIDLGGEKGKRVFPATEPWRKVVGRDSTLKNEDIAIPNDDTVSRKHFILSFSPQEGLILENKSVNSTFIKTNGESPLPQPHPEEAGKGRKEPLTSEERHRRLREAAVALKNAAQDIAQHLGVDPAALQMRSEGETLIVSADIVKAFQYVDDPSDQEIFNRAQRHSQFKAGQLEEKAREIIQSVQPSNSDSWQFLSNGFSIIDSISVANDIHRYRTKYEVRINLQ